MKNIIIISILFMTLFFSCNSNTNSNSSQENTTIKEEAKTPVAPKEKPKVEKPAPEKVDNIFEGMYSYMADANMFISCDKKMKIPVEMKGEYINLERQYLRAVDGGVEVYVKLKGFTKKVSPMEGDRKIDALVIKEILELSKDKKCL